MALTTSSPVVPSAAPGIPEAAWDQARWLPCQLSVEIPVPAFKVRDLLSLETGSIIDSRSASSADVPLRVNWELIGWAEFEVVGDRMAVRFTELA